MKYLYSLLFVLLFSISAPAQNAEPIIALGVLRPDDSGLFYVLDDDKRGTMELELSESQIEDVQKSPAESYEAEGYWRKSDRASVLFVTSLRPIE